MSYAIFLRMRVKRGGADGHVFGSGLCAVVPIAVALTKQMLYASQRPLFPAIWGRRQSS